MKDYKGCRYCKHYEFSSTCDAFAPEHIPIEIASGQFKHTRRHPAQRNDTIYEPAEGTYNERLVKHFENIPSFSIDDRIGVLVADITKIDTDAIVNAANQSLIAGGGVCGAIHRAAGPELEEACLALKWCEEGEAKITKGYQLPARWIIHTVGPVWEGGEHNEANVLSNCYTNCLSLAVKNKVKTIAFPSISTGTYGFPVDYASKTAIAAITAFLTDDDFIENVIFVCFSEEDFELYEKELKQRRIKLIDPHVYITNE